MGKTANINKDFDQNAFNKIDITKTPAIVINNKKAKIVTDHPSTSYTIHGDKKHVDSLSINDYKAFWRSSKYLVIVAE